MCWTLCCCLRKQRRLLERKEQELGELDSTDKKMLLLGEERLQNMMSHRAALVRKSPYEGTRPETTISSSSRENASGLGDTAVLLPHHGEGEQSSGTGEGSDWSEQAVVARGGILLGADVPPPPPPPPPPFSHPPAMREQHQGGDNAAAKALLSPLHQEPHLQQRLRTLLLRLRSLPEQHIENALQGPLPAFPPRAATSGHDEPRGPDPERRIAPWKWDGSENESDLQRMLRNASGVRGEQQSSRRTVAWGGEEDKGE